MNTEVLRAAAALAPEHVRVDVFGALAGLPHFNPDLDGEGATLPAPVVDFRAQVGAADALLISSPEYAHGVPGSLKNALDWLVSGPEIQFKPVGLLGVSLGSSRAHESLRDTLSTMSAVVVPGATMELARWKTGLDARTLAAVPGLSETLRGALSALVGQADVSRRLRSELGLTRA